jgi:phosphopantetheinyl transferase
MFWDLRHAAEQPALLKGEAPPGLLSGPERTFLARLRFLPRRRDWVLGRYVAKALCRAWLKRHGEEVAADRLTIAAEEDGAPFALLAGRGRLPLTLSISHRAGAALCALAEPEQLPLGADLELCETHSPLFAQDFFTESEARVAREAGGCRVETEIWCVKEAALKATRQGLTADTRSVEITPRASPASGWGTAEVRFPHKQPTLAFVRDEGPLIAALVLTTRASEPSGELRGFDPLSPPVNATSLRVAHR